MKEIEYRSHRQAQININIRIKTLKQNVKTNSISLISFESIESYLVSSTDLHEL